MDIFNRPPAISEDTVQYNLYPAPGNADKTSATTLATCIQSYVDSLLPGFLWHRDAFELKVVPDPDSHSDGWMLDGRMRVGDCVDDEWCVVWLLKEISAKWDVVISVFDSDGEFLLIEAAEALPSWVSPTNAENRVWIYTSQLHLIPLSHTSPPYRRRRRRELPRAKDSEGEGDGEGDDDPEWLGVEDALKLIRDQASDTKAPDAAEMIVWQRISRYPSAARDHVHITKVHLPIDIARALSISPSLIQKPIEAFYTRDALQLRAAHRMSRFPPSPSTPTTVKMTRTAYAQLVGQKFYPPKVFGRFLEKEGTKEWRRRDVGMKIAVGFEMLYQESKGPSDTSSSSADAIVSSTDARKDALRRNPDYPKFIQNLVSVGYFKGELEGSQLWNLLEDKAASTFIEVRKEDDMTRPSFAALVTAAVSQIPDSSIVNLQCEEDSDEWLNIDAQDFDNMLERTKGSTTMHKNQLMDVDIVEGNDENPEDLVAKEQAAKLRNLAEKVEEFVEGEGDVDGARFEDEEFSEEEFSDEKMTDSDDEMDQVIRQEAMDKLVPALPPGEYGHMPASFHTNSQPVARTTIQADVVENLQGPPESALFTTTESRSKPIRAPLIPRDTYDGVDSDDETDSEEVDEDEEEDRPQVVGDIEVDMGEEEQEFLEFSRKALGISDEQWGDIVRERRGRGAFVPAVAESRHASTLPASTGKKPVENTHSGPSGSRLQVNQNLDSFEAVMQAMDDELARSRKSTSRPTPTSAPGKGKESVKAMLGDDSEDIEAAMDAELKAVLERGEGGYGDDVEESEEPMDYNLIKNFLESFKSQGGLSGPASNLAGRLQPGWKLPRDDI